MSTESSALEQSDDASSLGECTPRGLHVALPVADLVRLLIADRRPTAASGLAAAFEQAVDLVVHACCHEIGDLSAALESRGAVDAVVIDADLFGGDASRTVDELRRLDPRVPILLLTTRVDRPLLTALSNERVSCVSAFGDLQTIVAALRALLGGQILLPPEVQGALMATLRQPRAALSLLTPREQEVLELAATGLTICQIAATLYISHSTAKTHLLRVYEKLEAPNRSAAVATAVARGLLRVGAATT